MYGAYLSYLGSLPDGSEEKTQLQELTVVNHELLEGQMELCAMQSPGNPVPCQVPGCRRCSGGRGGYVFRWYCTLWSSPYISCARPQSWRPGQPEMPGYDDAYPEVGEPMSSMGEAHPVVPGSFRMTKQIAEPTSMTPSPLSSMIIIAQPRVCRMPNITLEETEMGTKMGELACAPLIPKNLRFIPGVRQWRCKYHHLVFVLWDVPLWDGQRFQELHGVLRVAEPEGWTRLSRHLPHTWSGEHTFGELPRRARNLNEGIAIYQLVKIDRFPHLPHYPQLLELA